MRHRRPGHMATHFTLSETRSARLRPTRVDIPELTFQTPRAPSLTPHFQTVEETWIGTKARSYYTCSYTSLAIYQSFFSGRKNQYDWSSEYLISSIKLGVPRHSPVDLGVVAGENGGDASPGSGVLEGTSAQKSRFFISSEIFTKLSFFNILKIKRPKFDEKSEFGGRWV